MNINALVHSWLASFAIDMVIQDDLGSFVQGKNIRFAGSTSVMEVEAPGVQEALYWIDEIIAHHVIVKSDSLLVVNTLQKKVGSVPKFVNLN